jgi:hypothetical protein
MIDEPTMIYYEECSGDENLHCNVSLHTLGNEPILIGATASGVSAIIHLTIGNAIKLWDSLTSALEPNAKRELEKNAGCCNRFRCEDGGGTSKFPYRRRWLLMAQYKCQEKYCGYKKPAKNILRIAHFGNVMHKAEMLVISGEYVKKKGVCIDADYKNQTKIFEALWRF